ncbi:MAG: hypothetical protein JNM13_04520 [Hyphomicrobiaceae bacterium]|nr:hypothetical protein [Hyphomicrobiaceae bacterium]
MTALAKPLDAASEAGAFPGLDPVDLAVLDQWQRDFPLCEAPFDVVADLHGLACDDLIARLSRLKAAGIVSRLGATVRPNTAGASTLAAMAVAPDRLDQVAAIVSQHPFVNHNYQREHGWNLWFVVTAPDADELAASLDELSAATGERVLALPLEKPYHIDLGFRLRRVALLPSPASHVVVHRPRGQVEVDAADRRVLAALEDGLPLTSEPYAGLARAAAMPVAELLGRLASLTARGIVTRFGLILNHRALGFRANAMAVWDVPDHMVDEVAASMVATGLVSLCYRRPRRRPDWPYNLFAMIHAQDRAAARAILIEVNAIAGTRQFEQAVLFSTRCFKQRGAVFSARRREGAA